MEPSTERAGAASVGSGKTLRLALQGPVAGTRPGTFDRQRNVRLTEGLFELLEVRTRHGGVGEAIPARDHDRHVRIERMPGLGELRAGDLRHGVIGEQEVESERVGLQRR